MNFNCGRHSYSIITTLILGLQLTSAQDKFYTTATQKPLAWVKTNCYQDSGDRSTDPCQVESSGYLGKVENRFYFYVICREYQPPEDSTDNASDQRSFNAHSVSIFEGLGDSVLVKQVWSRATVDDAEYFEPPEIVETRYGYMFHIFISNGNGGWDDGEYFLRKDGKWIEQTMPDWNSVLKSKLPTNYSFCRGSQIDLESMSIELAAYTPDDGCCCPNGGSIYADLSIQNNQIKVDKAVYKPPKKKTK
jgi:hypothetical protein